MQGVGIKTYLLLPKLVKWCPEVWVPMVMEKYFLFLGPPEHASTYAELRLDSQRSFNPANQPSKPQLELPGDILGPHKTAKVKSGFVDEDLPTRFFWRLLLYISRLQDMKTSSLLTSSCKMWLHINLRLVLSSGTRTPQEPYQRNQPGAVILRPPYRLLNLGLWLRLR